MRVSHSFAGRKSFLAASILLAIGSVNAAEQLNQLQVSVTKAQMAPEDVQASFSVVTAEEIRKSGAKDVFEAIRRTTGVTVGANNSSIAGRKSIQIRGMDSSHVLMLVDGKRLTNTDSQVSHSNFQLNAVPIDSISHIEIVRGPMSSLYGSAGMAGVVNIVTKKAGNKWRSSADLFVGDIEDGDGGNERKVTLTTAGPLGDAMGIRFALEKSDVGVTFDKDTGFPATEMEGNEIEAFSTNVYVDVAPGHRLSFDYDRSSEDRFRDDPYYELQKHLAGLTYQGEIGGTSIDAKLYETYSDNYYVDSSSPYHHYLTDTVFSIDTVTEINESNQLIAGIEYRKEDYNKDYDNPARTDFAESVRYASIFVQDAISLMDDRLGITLGLRYDDHENFGGELSPKAYLDYEVNDDNRIGFGYGHGFKAPTVTQNADSYTATHGPTLTFIGNSSLKPETSDSYELVWEYDNGTSRARAAYFYNDITDLIDSSYVSGAGVFGDPRIFQYSNVHEAITQGVEFEFSRPVTDSLDVSFNVTAMDTEDGEYNGKALKQRPELFGNLALTHNFAPWDLQTTLNWEYVGEQFMDVDETDPVDGYSLVDLTFLKPVNDHLELRAGVTNIGDLRLADESPNFAQAEERGRFYFVGARATF